MRLHLRTSVGLSLLTVEVSFLRDVSRKWCLFCWSRNDARTLLCTRCITCEPHALGPSECTSSGPVVRVRARRVHQLFCGVQYWGPIPLAEHAACQQHLDGWPGPL